VGLTGELIRQGSLTASPMANRLRLAATRTLITLKSGRGRVVAAGGGGLCYGRREELIEDVILSDTTVI